MEGTLVWGIALALAVLGTCGAWFRRCGEAYRTRQARAFARRSLIRGGVGLLVGIALLSSDLGPAQLEQRMGAIALTACCALLIYAAGWAWISADDDALVMVNLTGRALLLADPELAPFFSLPAPREEPATDLPPILPRTWYVVSAALGRIGAQAGRTDVFTVDVATATDLGNAGLLVRRLIRAAPLEAEAPRA